MILLQSQEARLSFCICIFVCVSNLVTDLGGLSFPWLRGRIHGAMAGHLWCSTGAKACQGEELLGEDLGHVGVDGSLSHEGHLIHLIQSSKSWMLFCSKIALVSQCNHCCETKMFTCTKIFKFFTKASIKIRVKNIMMNFISTFAILKLILKLFTSNIQRHLRVLSQEADRWRRGRRKTAA